MINQKNQLTYVHALPNGPGRHFINTRSQPVNKTRLIMWIINDMSGWRAEQRSSNAFICCGVR